MSDFLNEKKQEIRGRMDELQVLIDELKSRIAGELEPLESEHRELDDALRALDGSGARGGGGSRRSGSARSSGSGESRGRGRPKGSGSRAKEALQLVKDRPGITIPEIAQAMDIKQNYLYRVMPDLQKDGLVRKEGRGWHALDAA